MNVVVAGAYDGMMTVMAVTANNYSGGDDGHKFRILTIVGIYFPVE